MRKAHITPVPNKPGKWECRILGEGGERLYLCLDSKSACIQFAVDRGAEIEIEKGAQGNG